MLEFYDFIMTYHSETIVSVGLIVLVTQSLKKYLDQPDWVFLAITAALSLITSILKADLALGIMHIFGGAFDHLLLSIGGYSLLKKIPGVKNFFVSNEHKDDKTP